MNRPLAWISTPVCRVADPAERAAEPTEHQVYRRVYEAHGRAWTSAATVGPVPDAWPLSAEDLALQALRPLLDDHCPATVDFFVDCRSGAMVGGPAPTYRLAMSAGMTTATPVCVWGQDGPELAFAISILARRLPAEGTAVLSACQRIVSPDPRAPAWTSLVLGDAAAAVLLSKRRFPGSRPILALQINGAARAGGNLLERTLHKAGLERDRHVWTLVADPRRSATGAASCSRWPDVYFGVADILVRLAEYSADRGGQGIGALLTHGRAGTSAAWILGTEECDVD